MNHSRLKYQQFFTALLLLFTYLVGNFSLPLFEGVHFLLHLGDDTPIHSFQSHDISHQHAILTNIDGLVASSTPTTDFPTDNTNHKKLKKIVQQLEVSPAFSSLDLLINISNYTTKSINYPTPFLSINSPPPKG